MPAESQPLIPMNKILILLTVVLLPGCFISRSTVDRPLDAALVSALVPGETNADEVASLMGAPAEVVQLGRRTAWRYEYKVEKQAAAFLFVLGLRGMDTQSDRVWGVFRRGTKLDPCGILVRFRASELCFACPLSTGAFDEVVLGSLVRESAVGSVGLAPLRLYQWSPC